MPTISLRVWASAIAGGVLVILVISLLVTRAALADCRDERAAVQTELAFSNASIGTLEEALDRVYAEQANLSAADSARIDASREALEMARAAERWREAAIERLNESAESLKTEKCEASPAVIAVWK